MVPSSDSPVAALGSLWAIANHLEPRVYRHKVPKCSALASQPRSIQGATSPHRRAIKIQPVRQVKRSLQDGHLKTLEDIMITIFQAVLTIAFIR